MKIGISADFTLDGNDLQRLEEDLDFYASAGFRYVELRAHSLDLIVNGRLNRAAVAKVLPILERSGLRFTVHCPEALDLMEESERELQKDVVAATIKFAGLARVEIVVCHTGRILLKDGAVVRGNWPLDSRAVPGRDTILRRREQEARVVRELAEIASNQGVTLSLENANIDTGVEAIGYSSNLSDLVDQVMAIDRPNVGIALDIGHAYIASKYYGTDFGGALRAAAPHVRHVHAHDNFGRTFAPGASFINSLPFGRGDLHLPPGWGAIPYAEVVSALRDYSGLVMVELQPFRYRKYYHNIYQSLRDLFEAAGGFGE
ncbi:MAG: sugar phosphate isomerase/epimerase [Firmicutes bacterium]|nr:sugar phosphate isomerase/epimerase [Bacillota bacterium]